MGRWRSDARRRRASSFAAATGSSLLEKALAPLRNRLTEAQFGRLAKALSLTFGLEVIAGAQGHVEG